MSGQFQSIHDDFDTIHKNSEADPFPPNLLASEPPQSVFDKWDALAEIRTSFIFHTWTSANFANPTITVEKYLQTAHVTKDDDDDSSEG